MLTIASGRERRHRLSVSAGAVKPLILMLAAALLLVPVAGCGKKGPPSPPVTGPLPPPVDDLKAVVDEGVVELTWTVPMTTGQHRLPPDGFRVLLSRQRIDDRCLNCPANFQSAGELKVLGRSGQAAGTQIMRFRYPLEAGYSYSFRVVPVGEEGVEGPVSDTVTVEK